MSCSSLRRHTQSVTANQGYDIRLNAIRRCCFVILACRSITKDFLAYAAVLSPAAGQREIKRENQPDIEIELDVKNAT